MDIENKYFLLNRECFFEKSIRKAAIYNLYTGDVFSIDDPLSEILEICENERLTVNDAIKKVNESKVRDRRKIFDQLMELVRLDLGEFYENKIFVEKIRPASTKRNLLINNEPPAIELMWLNIGNDCNLNCIHCYEPNGQVAKCGCTVFPDNGKYQRNLNVNEWKNVISDAALFNCQAIQFIGGEPLIFRGVLLALINYAKELNIPSISVMTNGVLLTPEIIDRFVAYEVHVILSIHSWQPEIHDSITNCKGSFEKVLTSVKEIQKRNGSFHVEIVVTQQNQDGFPKTQRFLHDLGAHDIHSQILRTKQDDVFADRYINKAFRTNCSFPKISKNNFFRNKEGNPCWNGKLAVLYNGDILPCMLARSKRVGNVYEKSLRQIIRESDLYDKYWGLTKDHIHVCNECEFRYACSDCRVMESIDGTLYAKNKFCFYNPSKGTWDGVNSGVRHN